MNRQKLTTKQRAVLDTIRALRREGRRVSARRIAERCGMSKTSVEGVLSRLSERGLVVRPGRPGAQRGYGTPGNPPPRLARGYQRVLDAIDRIREKGGHATAGAVALRTGYSLNNVKNRLDYLRKRGFIKGAGQGAGQGSEGFRVTPHGRFDPLADVNRNWGERGVQLSREAASSKPKAADDPKTRRCLMCQDNFWSSWPGERVCKSCKDTREWRAGSQDHADCGGRV